MEVKVKPINQVNLALTNIEKDMKIFNPQLKYVNRILDLAFM